ncbi:MAG: hypothetical protein LBH35_00140 [Treponema sp.]|jgi:hypothetical protein|nr:hypothetical protein [Treponema sp.]
MARAQMTTSFIPQVRIFAIIPGKYIIKSDVLEAEAAVLYGCGFLFFAGGCASRDGSGGSAIHEIAAHWAAIERSFLVGDTPPPFLAEEIDGFSASVDAFLNSRIYHMYRYVPLPRSKGITAFFGHPPPNEWEEAQSVKVLVVSFKEALERGDRMAALALLMDIHESLIYWQRLGLEPIPFFPAPWFWPRKRNVSVSSGSSMTRWPRICDTWHCGSARSAGQKTTRNGKACAGKSPRCRKN